MIMIDAQKQFKTETFFEILVAVCNYVSIRYFEKYVFHRDKYPFRL
jgi:hypothetical protein